MNISIITSTYKSDLFYRCRASVLSQTVKVEHVIVDGGSGDPWCSQIRDSIDKSTSFVSEPDNGIYDALNKGIKRSSGEIIGLLHSDDSFQSERTVEDVLSAFEAYDCNVVYGDLVYHNMSGRTIRYWRSKPYRKTDLQYGWMPPHPTVFVRRELLRMIGGYDDGYEIAGDYEFLLRLFTHQSVSAHYLPQVLTRMTLGGASNRDITHILLKMKEDIRAMKTHGINPWIGLPAKNLRKLTQFLPRRRTREGSKGRRRRSGA